MILGTFGPLIIPFLALSGVSGIHPVRAPASSTVAVVDKGPTDGCGSRRPDTDLAGSGREAASIR